MIIQNIEATYILIFKSLNGFPFPVLLEPILSIIPLSCKLIKILAIVLFESFAVSDKELLVLDGFDKSMLTIIVSFAVSP